MADLLNLNILLIYTIETKRLTMYGHIFKELMITVVKNGMRMGTLRKNKARMTTKTVE